ncbi:5-oxoprolinase subunit PxpA [Chitiniphilus eburneus]|uniref:5-oxoprolinase subunit PxpA n=1 Tax=Chitiniphilus eburneus TaxID=2571148 RepID=A0A4U0PRR9_9NEIS|nr:5-oxoprolinase subunit PxpA [Chitiniphilus eburneus]TJZ71031.1 5-oxoprolinase subunit PxpA [Chitiniphilus eburneus]
MAATSIDLNADLGEGGGDDASLMPLISSANIACGGHTGDVDSMRTAVRLACRHGVVIGAHPSYPGREHFGRVSMDISQMRLAEVITAQLWALKAVCIEEGVAVAYVKPHGALYNDAARHPGLAALIAATVREIDPDLALMGLAGSALIEAGNYQGLTTIPEAFVDRAYLADGSLMPRDRPGAVLSDDAAAVAQARSLTLEGGVRTADGGWLALEARSLCLHGDNPHALHLARATREMLARNEVRVVSALLA